MKPLSLAPWWALSLLLATTAAGQSQPVAAPAKPGPTYSTFAWVHGIDDLHVLSGGKSVRIVIPNGSRSQPLPLSAAGEIVFFREKKVDDQIVRIPAVTVAIPTAIERPLLVFIADLPAGQSVPVDKINYRVLVLEDSPAAFPAGSMNLVNVTADQIAARVNLSEAQLAAGAATVIPFAPDQAGDVRMRIARYDTGRQRWRPVLNTPLAAPADARLLVFAVDDAGRGGGINPRIIVEKIPVP